jgi:hypothetical protein
VQDGTAGAVALAREYVDEPVFIIFVDTIFDADLSVVKHTDADGIIWVKTVDDYQRFGVVVSDAAGNMTKIVEKPTTPISKRANIGLYYIRNWKLLYEGIEWTLNYLKKKGDAQGTGAKYTVIHVRRSAEFAAELLGKKGFTPADIKGELAQKIECVRLDLSLWLAHRRECVELSPSFAAQDGFGHDRASGVPGAEKQHIERFVLIGRVAHGYFLRRLPLDAGTQSALSRSAS